MEVIQLELPLELPEQRQPPEPEAVRQVRRLDEQEFAAIVNARLLLQRLSDPRLTPRVPRDVRAEARSLLRWLPRPEALREKAGPIAPWRVSPRVSQDEGCRKVAGERVFRK